MKNQQRKNLDKNGFKLVQTNREYSCNTNEIDIKKYYPLIKRLELDGIKFYDSKKSQENSRKK